MRGASTSGRKGNRQRPLRFSSFGVLQSSREDGRRMVWACALIRKGDNMIQWTSLLHQREAVVVSFTCISGRWRMNQNLEEGASVRHKAFSDAYRQEHRQQNEALEQSTQAESLGRSPPCLSSRSSACSNGQHRDPS